MGQYYKIVNIDKQEYLDPRSFGDGVKLMEFAPSGSGVMMGLAILLADGNGQGGGDLRSEHPVIGSWAGDRIVVSGDYAEPLPGTKTLKGEDKPRTAYNLCNDDEYREKGDPVYLKNVSYQALEALLDDSYEAEAIADRLWQTDAKKLPETLAAKLAPLRADAKARRDKREEDYRKSISA